MTDDETMDDGYERTNGRRPEVPLPRTERPDAPAYLRRYLERRAADAALDGDGAGIPVPQDPQLPLYLRSYRQRLASGASSTPLALPIPGDAAPTWTEPWAATSKSPEVVAPPGDASPSTGGRAIVDVHLIRHGETQGYSVNAGLTPMGRWQAHRRGHDLSKGVRAGAATLVVCAPTPRATETAEQMRRGIEQGLMLWARDAPVEGPIPMDEFRNFTVRTATGEKDVTAAYREYHAVGERYERVALGDRPLWLVEIDRFVKILRGGGDPIHYWMTVPLLSFEPATLVVLRFWAGITKLVADVPDGGRVLVATHSGPLRAFATWALGHDAGEPYNVEEVRVKVRRDLSSAQVTYRNRTAEVHVPPPSEWPTWMRDSTLLQRAAPSPGGS